MRNRGGRRRVTVACAVVALAAGLGACSSGDGRAGPPPPGPPPVAALSAPATDVLDVAAPRWIATADGSAVTARTTAASPGLRAVPELLLQATGHEGSGLLADVDVVQRLDTRGGQAPTGGRAGAGTRAVACGGEYRFYAAASP